MDNFYQVDIFGHKYDASDLSAIFLRELIAQVEGNSGLKIDKAVITVPAYFENLERDNTIKAGERAGLKVINIINEPTAAAIAYGLKNNPEYHKILIYDLGGGTFDVTVAEITNNSIDVLGSSGKHFLGGKNWDEAICQWMSEKLCEEFGVSFEDDKDAFNANLVNAERAKKQLSFSPYTDINVEYGDYHGKYRLTEEEFRESTESLLDITKNTIDELYANIGITWHDVDGVILVGGSTKMKMVKDYIIEMTGKAPLAGVHPDEAVSIGAAIQANIDEYCGTGESLGFLSGDNSYNLATLPGARYINDVVAHSLGMISVNENGTRFINDIMIHKNTPVKNAKVIKRRELSVRRKDELNELEIYLLQGDQVSPLDCSIAKKYVFSNISYVEGGKTKIDICYSYTLNGIIDIEAVQTETGMKLEKREEPVPEDMSWLSMSPSEYYASTIAPVQGAVYMALDLSGSMSGIPLEKAKKAMMNFVDQFDLNQIKIGIVGFSDHVKIFNEATSNRRTIEKSISRLNIGYALGVGNSAEPMADMYSRLKKFSGESFVYAIVLTDGMWNVSACTKALRLKKEYISKEIEIVCLGFGSADKKFISDLSTRDDLASFDDISQLETNLMKIAKVINEKSI